MKNIKDLVISLINSDIKINDVLSYNEIYNLINSDQEEIFNIKYIGEYLNNTDGNTYNIESNPININSLLQLDNFEPIFGNGLFILEVNKGKTFHFLATGEGMTLVFYNLY